MLAHCGHPVRNLKRLACAPPPRGTNFPLIPPNPITLCTALFCGADGEATLGALGVGEARLATAAERRWARALSRRSGLEAG